MSAEDRVAHWKRRAQLAEQQVEFERAHNVHTREWAERAFDEQRRLADRLTFVYGEARAAGLTVEQLAGPDNGPRVVSASINPDGMGHIELGPDVVKVEREVWLGPQAHENIVHEGAPEPDAEWSDRG